MGRVVAALCLIALVAGATDASGRMDSVRLRVAPSSVTAGGKVLVTAGVLPAGVRCNGAIRHRAMKLELRSKKAAGRTVSWRQAIPASAPVGTWTVRVACLHAGSATAKLSVTAPKPVTVPAKIVVVKSGLSTRTSGGTTYASWGAVLQNVSPDQDAMDVDVTLSYLNASGTVIRSTTVDYEGIPAKSTYYLGGSDTFQATPPSRVEVAAVEIGHGAAKALNGGAPIADIHESDDSTSAHVLGDFKNPYDRTLSNFASVSAVCFDAAGNVIDGGRAFAGSLVAPGSQVGFDVPILTLSASQIASAQVSVEPHFFR